MNSGFLQGAIMMLLFQHPYDPLIASDHREISLFRVHTDVAKQISGTCWSQLLFIDFKTPIKNLPLGKDRQTGSQVHKPTRSCFYYYY